MEAAAFSGCFKCSSVQWLELVNQASTASTPTVALKNLAFTNHFTDRFLNSYS
jgi:hypothetical protein